MDSISADVGVDLAVLLLLFTIICEYGDCDCINDSYGTGEQTLLAVEAGVLVVVVVDFEPMYT